MKLLMLTVLAAFPTAALAQVPAVAPPYHPAIDNPQVSQAFARTAALNSSAMASEAFNGEFNTSYFDRQMADWRGANNPRRVRRAEAAAELINGGDCDGAKALAVRDRDERLTARIEEVCTLINVSDPVAAASGS